MTFEKDQFHSLENENLPQSPPNVWLFDHDAVQFMDSVPGMHIDTAAIGTFLRDHDVDGKLQDKDEFALRFYRPDGRLAQENSEAASPLVVGHNWPTIVVGRHKDEQIPAPIGLQYRSSVSDKRINFTLRHELFHYLYGNHNRLDDRDSIRTPVRLGALATSLTAASSIPELLNKTWIYHETVIEKTSTHGLVGTLLGLSITALYTAAVANNPRGLLRRFDMEERRADAFARRYRDFNPITVDRSAS